MVIIISITLAALVVLVILFFNRPEFGKVPKGESLAFIKQSTNYQNKKFMNLSYTPDITEGVSYIEVLRSFIFDKSKHLKPAKRLPSIKTDLHKLDPDEDILVWFGHSSYFIQLDGKKILVDPVFSGNASPIPNSMKSFAGSDIYFPEDIPTIDYLFITHDHWDHLDYKTIVALKPKIKQIITGLGTALHLKHWGFDAAIIIEKDWHEEILLTDGFVVNTLPARHFSGRGLTNRQQSLWMSFAFKTPSMNLFIGGDSGYDTHFKIIGKQYGPFDLAILECGQYHKNWRYIHSMPEEVVLAANDLQTIMLLPVHWAKFPLAQHDWDEPILKVTEIAAANNLLTITPMIGETVHLKNKTQHFERWWEGIK